MSQEKNNLYHLSESSKSCEGKSEISIGNVLICCFGIFWLILLLFNIKLFLGALCLIVVVWVGWLILLAVVSKLGI